MTWNATNPNVAGSWSSWSRVPAGPADARELAVATNVAGDTFTDSIDGLATGTLAVPDPDTGWIRVSGELAPFPS